MLISACSSERLKDTADWAVDDAKLLLEDSDKVKDKLMKHLIDKYDEEFVFEKFATNQRSNTDIYAYPKAHDRDDDWKIRVSRDNETGEISDTYANIIFREEGGAEILKIANKIFPEAIVVPYAGGTLLPETITKESSLRDFFEATSFPFVIVVKPENIEEAASRTIDEWGVVSPEASEQYFGPLVQQFTDEISAEDIQATFEIYFVNETGWSKMRDNPEEAIGDFGYESGSIDFTPVNVIACGEFDNVKSGRNGFWRPDYN
jgi:hypothetical protein